MRDEGEQQKATCPRCGTADAAARSGGSGADCPVCRAAGGREASASGGGSLAAVRGAPGGDSVPPPTVRLLREFKGPTVDELIADVDAAGRLPGRVRKVLDDITAERWAQADAALDRTVASVHPGPGFRTRPRRAWLWLLWGIALALFMWGLWSEQ